jgi:hypothetical protein
MTTTINTWWHQPDERELGREDSCWYTIHNGHDAVVTVGNDEGREITIYADGEMRVHLDHEGDIIVLRYCEKFTENGINNDADIFEASESGRLEWIHNSWFDLYATAEDNDDWLDCVCHSLTEAIEQATALLSDDKLWDKDEDE